MPYKFGDTFSVTSVVTEKQIGVTPPPSDNNVYIAMLANESSGSDVDIWIRSGQNDPNPEHIHLAPLMVYPVPLAGSDAQFWTASVPVAGGCTIQVSINQYTVQVNIDIGEVPAGDMIRLLELLAQLNALVKAWAARR